MRSFKRAVGFELKLNVKSEADIRIGNLIF